MSTIPGPKALVDATVGVLLGFFPSQLRFHAFHSGAERVAAFAALGLRGLQVHALLFGRGSPLGVEATIRILAFLALPCWCLSHLLPLTLLCASCQSKEQQLHF